MLVIVYQEVQSLSRIEIARLMEQVEAPLIVDFEEPLVLAEIQELQLAFQSGNIAKFDIVEQVLKSSLHFDGFHLLHLLRILCRLNDLCTY